MKRAALFIALGALLGAALPTYLVARLARLTLSEIRDLHRIVNELKRRLSVARVEVSPACDPDTRHRVSMRERGDPEGYAERICYGPGDAYAWLFEGAPLGETFVPPYGPNPHRAPSS